MDMQKKIALLIIHHLKRQLSSGNFSEEAFESLEVSIQCIESAYNLTPNENEDLGINLEEILELHFLGTGYKPNNKNEVSQAKKEEAEYHKNCGNEFMKNQNNEKAIEAYSKSISLNPTNPIYHCNRAAAYNAVGRYNDAIEDCQKAIELDSTYCKAYCRLGLAFSYLKDYHKAVSCYKKACELDPGNVGYQRNYQLTLNNLEKISGSQSQAQNESATAPNIMETASRLMSDPEVSSILNNILGDVQASGSGGIDRLMQVGQTIVTHMHTANPNLLDGLRMQFQNVQNEGQQPPPSMPPHDDNIRP